MFSQQLKNLRERNELSQMKFAEEIGYSQAAVSAWENNTREPGIIALLRIAQYFNVSVDYMLSDSPIRENENDLGVISIQDQKTVPRLSLEEQRLIEDYRELAPALRELLQATIRTWKNPDANANVRKKLK